MTAPTILIADDDKAICTVLSHAARRRGWEPMITHHGETLMEWVRQGKGDVVITDVRMPVGEPYMNGLDMLPDIRRLRADLPVIVISAQNTLMTAVRATQVGAYEYMPKPFDLNVLFEHVAKSLERAGKAPEATEKGIAGRARRRAFYRHIACHAGNLPYAGADGEQ